jgi:RNA methyltransferase, TrmH family
MESPNNANFKRWKELLSSRGIKKHGQFLVFGKKLVQEILEQNPSEILEKIDFSGDTDSVRTTNSIRGFELSLSLFKELDLFGTASTILVCRMPEIPVWDSSLPPSELELVSPIGDPSNLGALLRSSLAFDVSQIVLLRESAHPFHPKSIRALSANPYSLNLLKGPDLKSILEMPPPGVVALDSQGKSLSGFKWPKNIRLLVGEEGPGFSGNLRKVSSLKIDVSSTTESLNATVAASIAMFSFRSQHPLR